MFLGRKNKKAELPFFSNLIQTLPRFGRAKYEQIPDNNQAFDKDKDPGSLRAYCVLVGGRGSTLNNVFTLANFLIKATRWVVIRNVKLFQVFIKNFY